VQGTEIACTVVVGGTLKDKKGMNLPGVAVSAPSLTEKDKDDAHFALGLGVDWLALSFVRKAADVRELRALVAAEGGSVGIVSKIEKPEALEHIEDILEASDGIMVARGDLGVELPPERVPIAQSQLVEMARARGKPVIVATQMMESMISNPRPTRAEVSDVAGAVWSGTDAVMLSAETASGSYPVAAVEMMDRVARDAEAHLWARGAFGGWGRQPFANAPLSVEEAVAHAATQLSRDLMVRAIVVFTRSGRSASTVSTWRPQAPVLARSSSEATCRRMMLSWGVVPVLGPDLAGGEFPTEARRLAVASGLAKEGDAILQVSDFAADPAENQPSVVVLRVTG
jgi:pyruvate kinase